MINFPSRSSQKELLDQDNIPFDDIRLNMKELDVINSRLGGHKITLKAFERLVGNERHVSVCEIGCGGGDNLAAIARFAAKKNISVELSGIDIKQECIDYTAQSGKLPKSTTLITSDYEKLSFENKPDVIFSSLFAHHFTGQQLVSQVKWMKENSSIGFFINDLQRNPLAYYSIKILTRMFSSSYLVKNDAPVSVLRGFHKSELEAILSEAGIERYSLEWKWAFRYLVIYEHASKQAI
jgi:2-polyprenyl-3-methyl-5-hydroxy-6-metoxy-1,4-benzoquinol methylase